MNIPLKVPFFDYYKSNVIRLSWNIMRNFSSLNKLKIHDKHAKKENLQK